MSQHDGFHNAFEEAFLRRGEVLNIKEGDVHTRIQAVGDQVSVIKTENVDSYLKQAKIERDNFQMQRGSDKHWTKVSTIPMVMYTKFMEECDTLGITNPKERNRYVIHKIKSPEFAAMLTIPKPYIRD